MSHPTLPPEVEKRFNDKFPLGGEIWLLEKHRDQVRSFLAAEIQAERETKFKPVCKKCGESDLEKIRVSWISQRQLGAFVNEYLDCLCQRCSYQWSEQVLNKG